MGRGEVEERRDMGLKVQVRKDGDGVAGACVRIEFGGGSLEGTTGEEGWVEFEYEQAGPVTLWLDGQRRGTYDYATSQSVTIMT
jgi:hypothetical protein